MSRALRKPLVRVSISLLAAFAAEASPLCAGLTRDRLPHPPTPLSKPALGEALVDPELGGTLRRITDAAPGAGDAAVVPLYSTVSAWNADESLLLLYRVGHGHELYDGRSYAFLRALDIEPSDIEHVFWHTRDRDVLLYPSGNRLVRYRVSSGAKETVREFEFCGGPVGAGSDPMFSSWDSNVIGLRCDDRAFLYRLDTDTVAQLQDGGSLAPQPAPSGMLALLAGDVRDAGLGFLRRLDLANAGEHASLGRLASGHDTYNAVAFDAGPGGSGVGSLVTHDLQTGVARVLIGPDTGYPYPPSGTHLSALTYRNPGWVVLSIVGNPSGSGVLDNEIALADTNTGEVCRAAHHRSWGRNNTQLQNPYWAEPHVVTSPSGTRALFASDWGNGATVDSYVLELPSHATPALAVWAGQPVYTTGEALGISLALTNPGLAVSVDLLVTAILPDGDSAVSFTPIGLSLGRLSHPSTLLAAGSSLSLAAPFAWSGTDAFQVVFPAQAPVGGYRLVFAAVRPGALADDAIDPGDVVAFGSALVTFTR